MEWILSASRKVYDHDKAFRELPYIDWVQRRNFEIGDIVYIYSSKPEHKIDFMAEVIKTDISAANALDDIQYWNDLNKYKDGKQHNRFVRLKLIFQFTHDAITYDQLKAHGLKSNLQGAEKLFDQSGSLKEYGGYIQKRTKNARNNAVNTFLDSNMQLEIANDIVSRNAVVNRTVGPVAKPSMININGKTTYKRSKNAAINALISANFSCEIEPLHPTFLRKKDMNPYTEPHHLIPMAYQDEFEYSIDIEENIISLCSNCHNEIHYGANAKQLLTKLYNSRKDVLKSKKVDITLQQLLSFYSID